MTMSNRGSRKWLLLMLGVFFITVSTIGCVNDLTPHGGWSSPVLVDNKLLIGNVEGKLVRLDLATGNLDLSLIHISEPTRPY